MTGSVKRSFCVTIFDLARKTITPDVPLHRKMSRPKVLLFFEAVFGSAEKPKF